MKLFMNDNKEGWLLQDVAAWNCCMILSAAWPMLLITVPVCIALGPFAHKTSFFYL